MHPDEIEETDAELDEWLDYLAAEGLLGFHGPARPAPTDFPAHPGHWMEWVSTYQGTFTDPNFASADEPF